MNVLYFGVQTADLITDDIALDDMDIAVLSFEMTSYPSGKALTGAFVPPTTIESKSGLAQYFDMADCIVTFNANRFDYNVMLGVFHETEIADWKEKTIDLLPLIEQSLGRRTAFNTLVKHTLDKQRAQSGKEAVRLWQLGDKPLVVDNANRI